jgi:hypothetical protein
MADPAFHAALERRYDGPLPAHAAVADDWDRPWREQIAGRKRLAWMEVRRLARRAAAAGRTTGPDRERASLGHALKTWALYRNWLRALDRRR